MPGRNHAGGDFAARGAGVFGVDATVGPAVEAHGRIAGEDHAEQDLHRAREPPRSVVRPGGQRRIGVDEADGGERHGEDRMGELHQRKVFRYGIHAKTVFAAAKIAKAEGNRKTSSDCRDGPEKRGGTGAMKGENQDRTIFRRGRADASPEIQNNSYICTHF